MSCIYKYKGKDYTKDEFYSLVSNPSFIQQEQTKKFAELQERLNNKEFLEGAKNAFESSEELQEWGTQEQYNDFIARVSLGIIKNPSSGGYNYDSKVKDIVYHGTDATFEKFMKMYNNIHFGTLKAAKERLETIKKIRKSTTENIYPVILNIEKPIITDADFDWELDTAGEQPDPYELIKTVGYLDNWLYENGYLPKEESDIFGLPDKSIPERVALWKNHDSYIYINFVEDKGSKSYSVFEPEQIHILGSKQDIKGFKTWIKDNTKTVRRGGITPSIKGHAQFSTDNGLMWSRTDERVQYQEAVNIPSDSELNTKIKSFLAAIGVSYQAVESLTDSDGNPLDGIALARLVDKIVQVVEGKAKIDTLPEEAAHFFVAMLPKDHNLYKTMFAKIESMQVYQDVLAEYGEDPNYKDNPVKLKEEAMGKVIASMIVNQFLENESAAKQDFINKWWNALVKWISSLFKKFNKDAFYREANKLDAFNEAAEQILSGNTSQLGQLTTYDMFFQKETPKATEVKDLILDKAANIIPPQNDSGKYILKDGNETKELGRTTDLVKELDKKRGWKKGTRTKNEETWDEVAREWGTNTHNALNNILKRVTEYISGNPITAKDQFDLSDKQYNKLEEYVKELVGSYPPGTVFLSEVVIADPNYKYRSDDKFQTGLGGTIDLLVITPEGKIDIYDWKTLNLTNKTEIPYFKQENWNVQLSAYKRILMSYGVPKESFGKLRVIPISTSFDQHGNLKELNIGDKKNPLLKQFPVVGLLGGEVEYTGDKATDEIIDVLRNRMQKLMDLNIPYKDIKKRALRDQRVENIKASIQELQLSQTFGALLDEAKFELNLIANTPPESMTADDLLKTRDFLIFYSRLTEHGVDVDSDLKVDLGLIISESGRLLNTITSEIEARAIKTAEEVDVKDLLGSQREMSFWSRWFRSISQQYHPVIQAFYRLVARQQDKIYSQSEQLRKRLEASVNALKSYSGSSGTEIFKPFLQFKDGQWTGRLIPKYKAEYYTKKTDISQNLTKEGLKWLRDNTVFDQAKFKAKRAEHIETWKQLYKGDKRAKEKLAKKVANYDANYDVINHPDTAYANKKNWYLKPTDNWLTEEYLNIQKVPALADFYNLFQEVISDAREKLGQDFQYNFVPNIQNDIIDSIAQNGFGSIAGLKPALLSGILAKADNGYGIVDELTGEVKKSVPIYYTNEIDPSKKSQDLASSLYMFANMAYTHEHMSEIEASSNMLKDVLTRKSKTILTDANGNPIKNAMGKIQEVLNSSDALAAFNEYMDYYIYGIRTQGRDKILNVDGEQVSLKLAFSKTLKYYSAKSLALNIVSSLANGFGGTANAFIEGAKSRFYTNSEYRQALKDLGANTGGMPRALMEFFDIQSTHNTFKKASNLSASKVSKSLTYDRFYTLMAAGDYVVENSVLLAMLRSHTIRDGKIVKKTASEKSLYESAKIENDKIVIEGLTAEEFGKFRRKVKYLYTTMKGNNSEEDINSVRLNVFGQAMMQFRNWIPRMADARFGGLRYTSDLETVEQGYHATFYGHIFNKSASKFKNLVQGLTAYGFLGFGAGLTYNSLKIAAEKKWDTLPSEEKAKYPKDAYVDMYVSNLRAAALEMQVIITVGILAALLKGDDDDDRTGFEKMLIKIANRNLQELTFFTDPRSATQLLGGRGRTVIPVLGLANELFEFGEDLIGQTVGVVTLNGERMDKNKPLRKGAKLIPYFNTVLPLTEEMGIVEK